MSFSNVVKSSDKRDIYVFKLFSSRLSQMH